MLVGDIYGDRDYSNIGLSATTIASSFGKVVSEGKDLEDMDPADIALALCRSVTQACQHAHLCAAVAWYISTSGHMPINDACV